MYLLLKPNPNHKTVTRYAGIFFACAVFLLSFKMAGAAASLDQTHYRWRDDTGAEAGWETKVVDSGGTKGLYTSIIAPSGTSTIYASYYNASTTDILFAKSTDGGITWTTSTIDSASNTGLYTSIVAPSGTSTIYVSYYLSASGDLRFAKSTNGGATWTSSTIDSAGTTGLYTSITAPSGTSTIYISYQFNNTDLFFAKSTDGGSTWTTSSIDRAGTTGLYTSITAPSGTSTIYISYGESGGGDLLFAKSTDGGATWTSSTIDSAGTTGLYTSITAPSGTSTIYVSYQLSTGGDLRFAKSTDGGATWTSSTIDSAGTTGLYTSITAPSGTSTIYISYYEATADDLLLASSTDGGATWTTSTIDSVGITGLYTSIIAPSSSIIYISYQDQTNQSLRFARMTREGLFASFSSAEDTPATNLAKSTTTRLRFQISNEGDTPASSTLRLEYQENATTGAWTAVPATASSEHWVLSDSSYITDGESTRNIMANGPQALTDANTLFVPGELRDAQATTSAITLSTTQFTEIEYALRTTASVTNEGVYYFRLTNNGTTTDHSYSVYPKATVAGEPMTQFHYRFRNDTEGEIPWTTSTIDAGGTTGLYTSIVSPATSTIYVSYQESGQADLLFAKSTDGGATWTTSTVDVSNSTGLYTSMKTPDGTSTIYISYQNASLNDLMFAKSTNGGTTWTTSTIDNSGVGAYTSMATPAGTSTIYISYKRGGDGDLLFAKSTNGGSTWTTSTADVGSNNTGFFTSIAAPTTSTIYISYIDVFTAKFQLASSSDGGVTWSTSSIRGGFGATSFTSLIAPEGTSTLYLAFYGTSANDLFFAKSTDGGGTWTSTTVDTAEVTGNYVSIVAPSGTSTIYISYQNDTQDDLLFAKSLDGGTTWTTSTLDVSASSGLWTSIIAPTTSTIYISYQGGEQNDLRFAKSVTGDFAYFAADQDAEITGLSKGSTTRIRFEISNEGTQTATSTFRVEYQENSTSGAWTAVPATATSQHWEMSASSYIPDGETTRNIYSNGTSSLSDENTFFVSGELRDARATTSAITLTTTDFTELEYSIRATTTATDSGVYYFRLTNNGTTTNFVYKQYPKVTLASKPLAQIHYRWRNDVPANAGWTKQAIDAGGSTGINMSLAVPTTSTLYVSYYQSSGGDLLFASSSNGGATWATSTVDAGGTTGRYTSIVVPVTSTIYISYQQQSPGADLLFAKSTNDGATWTTSTIDSSGTTGLYTSMETPSGTSTIYISYQRSTGSDLLFAKSTDGGTTWTTSTIDAGGSTGSYTSLVAFTTSTLYVSYYQTTGGDLLFASSTDGGTTWTTSTIDAGGTTGQYTSLVVPTTSTLYVSYYQSSGADLLFAKSTNDGVTWTTSTINAGGSTGQASSLAAPTTSTLYVSYQQGGVDDDLLFASSTDGGVNWTTSTIDAEGVTSLYTSLVALSTSSVYIGYHENVDGDLLFANMAREGSFGTFASAEDTALTGIAKSSTTRLRFEISNEGSVSASDVVYRIEYSLNSTSGPWIVVPATASSEHWEMSASSYITDGEASTNINAEDGITALTDENTTFVAGEIHDTRATTSPITLTTTQFTELEYSLRATTNATDYGTYYFRLTNNGTTTNFSYDEYARVSLAGLSMTQVHYRWRNDDGVEQAWSTSTLYTEYLLNGATTGVYFSLDAPTTSTIYAAFQMDMGADEDFYFAKSTDTGITWTTTTIDAGGRTGVEPSLRAPTTSTIYVSYHQTTGDGLLFASSSNGGVTWTTTTVDSEGNMANQSSIYIPSTSTIYISYSGVSNILAFAKSTNDGATWTTSTIDAGLNSITARSLFAPTTSTIYIGYMDSNTDNLLFAKSTDGGTTWTTSTIDANGAAGYDVTVSAPTTSTIYIGYFENDNNDYLLAKSVNSGTSWTTSTIETNGNPLYGNLVALSTSTIYASFQQNPENYVEFASSTDGGATWATSSIGLNDGDSGYTPSLAVPSASTMYIAYGEGSLDLLLARSVGGINEASFSASEDTEITGLAKSSTTRLRFEISNESTGTATSTFRLEYQANATTGSWTAVPATASSEHWEMSDTPYIIDGEWTRNISGLTDENSTFVYGQLRDGRATTSAITLTTTNFTEVEYSMRATAQATDSGVYYFRLTDNGTTTNFTYVVYPKVTLGVGGGSTLTLGAHAQGQTSNKFEITPASVTDSILLAFKLTPSESLAVSTTTIDITNYSGFVEGNFTNFELFQDVDADGAFDTGEPSLFGAGAISLYGTTGTIIFSGSWTATTTSNIILEGDVASINDGDYVTIQISTSGISASGVTVSGPAQNKNHAKPSTTFGGGVTPHGGYSTGGVEQTGGDEEGTAPPAEDVHPTSSVNQSGGGAGGGQQGAPMFYCIAFPNSPFCVNLRSTLDATENTFQKILQWLWL